MKRPERLQRILRLAEQREQSAARRLQAARQERSERSERLQQFRSYRDEYAEQFGTATRETTAAGLYAVREFVARIDDVIETLDGQTAHSDRRYRSCIDQWTRERASTRALTKIYEREQALAGRTAERRLQGELDQRASTSAGAVESPAASRESK